jgi:hypothetical protein
MRVSTPNNAPSWASLRRHENGNVNTHCQNATSCRTSSIRFAAVAHMRRPRHDGQKPPLPLFLRLGAAVQARVHAYRIDWEARAA